MPLGQWVHLAGTYDGTRIILYVNGVERARVAKTGALVASSRPVLLGANANGTDPLAGGEFLAGGLDEVRLFSRALDASEVAALATPPAPPEIEIEAPLDEADSRSVRRSCSRVTPTTPGRRSHRSDRVERGPPPQRPHTPDLLPSTTGAGGTSPFSITTTIPTWSLRGESRTAPAASRGLRGRTTANGHRDGRFRARRSRGQLRGGDRHRTTDPRRKRRRDARPLGAAERRLLRVHGLVGRWWGDARDHGPGGGRDLHGHVQRCLPAAVDARGVAPLLRGPGTTAFDASGNGNNAELRNGATWGPGRIGGGLALDGTNDLAAIANAPSLAFSDKLTVAGWTRRTAAPVGWHNLVSRQLTTTNADQLLLAFKDATPYFGVNTPNGGTLKAGSGSVPLGQWVHLAGTYDGTRIILYVNGVERARVAKTGALVASSRPVLLGANANGTDPLAGAEFLAGGLDEVRLFSRALDASEVAALAAGFDGHVPTSRTVRSVAVQSVSSPASDPAQPEISGQTAPVPGHAASWAHI